jgi:hypothetical protein
VRCRKNRQMTVGMGKQQFEIAGVVGDALFAKPP